MRGIEPVVGAPTLRVVQERGWDAHRSLTISDACSAIFLRAQAVEKTDTERVRRFRGGLREYGLRVDAHDNGPPFGSSAVGGLSRLAVWWIKLGIVPERIEAGTSGAERAHEDAPHAELELHPAQDWRGSSGSWTGFVTITTMCGARGAGMQTPASVYEPSPREYPAKVPDRSIRRDLVRSSRATVISAGRSMMCSQ